MILDPIQHVQSLEFRPGGVRIHRRGLSWTGHLTLTVGVAGAMHSSTPPSPPDPEIVPDSLHGNSQTRVTSFINLKINFYWTRACQVARVRERETTGVVTRTPYDLIPLRLKWGRVYGPALNGVVTA